MNSFVLSPFEKMKSRIAFGGDGSSDAASCTASVAAGAAFGSIAVDGNPVGVVGGAAAGFLGNYDCISTVTNAVTSAFSASSPNDSFYNAMGDSGWKGGDN